MISPTLEVTSLWMVRSGMKGSAALARLPGHSEGGPIEIVHDFTDLGSNITVDGEIRDEVKCRIGKAARAFGCLQRSIFQNRSFSTETKQRVYRATVLSVLLYGAETWTTKTESMRQLNAFHNRCVRTIMGITKYQQWKEKITSKRLAAAFGVEETMTHLLMKHRLRWLGHLARMEPIRMPKQLLFGELEKKRPSHGTKRRWRDVVAADIKAAGVSENWYEVAQDRRAWRALCQDGISSLVEQHSQGWPLGSAFTQQLLFGELEKKRPSHGMKRRWRDVVAADIKAAGVSENWYEVAQDRRAWRALCQDGISSLVEQHSQGWPLGSAFTQQLLFGELEKKRPSHGTKRRWRDVVAADIKAAGVSEDWYEVAQDRRAWRALCQDGISSLVEQHSQGWPLGSAFTNRATCTSFTCVCGRSFRRKGDLTRHTRFCGSAGTAVP